MNTSHEELESMLAAAAVDALPPDEQELLERHLQHCPRCRAELSEHRQSAALLVTDQLPPAGVWDQISATIGRSGSQEMPVSLRRVVRRRSRWVRGWTVVATACAAAVVALAIWVASLHGEVSRLDDRALSTQLNASVAKAMTSPGHTVVPMQNGTGIELAHAVISGDGTAFFVPDSLPALPSGRTYQLWARSHGAVVSLGVIGPSPSVGVFHYERQMTELMITNEPSGGEPAPTTAVLASGAVTGPS